MDSSDVLNHRVLRDVQWSQRWTTVTLVFPSLEKPRTARITATDTNPESSESELYIEAADTHVQQARFLWFSPVASAHATVSAAQSVTVTAVKRKPGWWPQFWQKGTPKPFPSVGVDWTRWMDEEEAEQEYKAANRRLDGPPIRRLNDPGTAPISVTVANKAGATAVATIPVQAAPSAS